MKDQDELRGYVQKKLRRGYPQGELRNELVQEGYSPEEIDGAIYEASLSTAGRTKGATGNNPVWFIITTGLGIVGLSLVSVPFLTFLGNFGYPLIIIGAAGIFIKFLLPFISKKN